MLEASNPSPGSTPSRGIWLVALLVLLGLAWGLWSLFAPDGGQAPGEPSVPSVVAASDLPADLRAEREVEATAELDRLSLLERQLAAREDDLTTGGIMGPAQVRATVAKLQELEAIARNPASDRAALEQAYRDTRDFWRERTLAFEAFLGTSPETDGLVPFNSRLYAEGRGLPSVEAYRREYQVLAVRFEKLRARQQVVWEAELQGRAERLQRITRIRFELLDRCRDAGASPVLEDPVRSAQDALLELSSFPARWSGLMRLRFLEMHKQVGGGLSLAMSLLQEGGLVLFGLLLGLGPAVVAARRGGYPGRPLYWGLAFLAAVVGRWAVAGTLGDLGGPLLFLVEYYVVWRLYLYAVETTLGPAVSWLLGAGSPAWAATGVRTLRRLGQLFLARAVLLRLVVALAGPGVLLFGLDRLLDLVVLLLLWSAAWAWRRELGLLVQRLAPASLGPALASPCLSPRTGWLVAPVAALAVLGLILLNLALGALSRFESGKRLSAGVLRRWMEVSGAEPGPSGSLPEGYREAFLAVAPDPLAAWQLLAPGFLGGLHAPIDGWREGGPGTPVLVVHGNPGSGLSTVVEHLQRHYSPRMPVVPLRLSARITSASELVRATAQAFGLPPQAGAEDLARALSGRPPTLVVLPEANRLFLATVGGFEAWRALQLLVRRCREQLFWVLAMGTPALSYLRAVHAEAPMAAHPVHIPRWSDEALRSMILRRHAATGRPLIFADSVRRASEGSPGSTPESHYFQVLWEQSAGNPSVARELWMAGAGEGPDGALRVGLPPRTSAGILARLSEATLFVLAAVVRHEALTARQVALALSLSERRAFLACEQGLEAGVLELTEERLLRVPPLRQADIFRFLRERNLLDGF